MNLTPIPLLLILFLASAAIGMASVKKMIEVREAKHELKQGSAGFLRGVAGWSIVALWAMLTGFCASFLGDWQMSGDLEGALERSGSLLRVLLEIAMTLEDE